jgi:hypothetical protein
MLPVLAPLVQAPDTLSGTGTTLILRASPATVAAVREAVARLDRPLRRLNVSVRRIDARSAERLRIEAEGELGVDSQGGSTGNLRIRGDQEHSTRREDATRSLLVNEGARAFIAAGQSVAYPQGGLILVPGGTAVGAGVAFRDVDSGFYVRPRLTGDGGVVLDIEPFEQALRGDGRIEVQRAATTLTARLGEWVTLAGADTARRVEVRRVLGTRREAAEGEFALQVRVEIAP